jgi:hypothetical protein
VWRVRIRSPLRWLSAVMTSLLIIVIAGGADFPWLLLAIPVAVGLFLFAPAIWVYQHDETPIKRTGMTLEAYPVAANPGSVGTARFRLVLSNHGEVPAHDVRVRLLIPTSIIPADSRTRPIGNLLVGELGRNWFVDTAYDATAITLRTARPGDPEEIVCPANSSMELADLLLPMQGAPYDIQFDYQISGGSAKATLGELRIHSGE